MTGALVVIGAGGHSRPVIDAAFEAGFDVRGVIDIGYRGQREQILGCEVIGGPDRLDGADLPRVAALAIGDNEQRRTWFERLTAEGWTLPRIVHPRAVVSRFCDVGEAAFVNAGAVLNAGVEIGRNSIVNTGSVIDHETVVGAHTHIAPGVRLAGRARVGQLCFIGIGATVIQLMKVGDGAVVGAGAVVIRDVAEGTTVVGVPARIVG